MPKILTRLRIDEVSAVDRGAGEGVKIVLMKRDDTGRSFNDFMAKADAADDGGNDAGDITNQHPVVQAARLLVASGKFGDHGDALDYLLNTSGGQALLTRMKAAEPAKEFAMDNIEKLTAERTENLLKIGKSGGAVAMAKVLVADDDAHGITEPEFTQILTEHAQKLYPAKSPDSAFAAVFSDNGADGVMLRKAHAVVRASQFAAGGAYPYPR
jgi:hypothetical protein